MEIDQSKIEAAIVQQAVDGIVRDDDLYERVKRGIESRIDGLFKDRVTGLVEAAIDAAVKSGFEREYTKHDSFGRPLGEPTSISKELERIISSYWTEHVDRDGKPTSSGYNTVPRAEWLMAKICADDFSKEMKQHVVNVGGALKDHFREVLNQQVASMLSEVFHVQSEGDRALSKPGRSSIDPAAKPIGSK